MITTIYDEDEKDCYYFASNILGIQLDKKKEFTHNEVVEVLKEGYKCLTNI
jgi:hypothetical protein